MLKIRDQKWKLLFVPKLDCYGHCDFENKVIRVNTSPRKRIILKVLIHEALHASLGPEVTEKEITQIERDIYAVLKEGLGL